jgi:hypothetical protein
MGNEELRAVVDGIDAGYFTDTLTVDFGEPTERTADGLIAEWAAILHRAKRSHHLRTHHAYEGNDSAAAVYSHAYIINVLDGHVWELWATFVHRLVRMQAGWRKRDEGFVEQVDHLQCFAAGEAVTSRKGDEARLDPQDTGLDHVVGYRSEAPTTQGYPTHTNYRTRSWRSDAKAPFIDPSCPWMASSRHPTGGTSPTTATRWASSSARNWNQPAAMLLSRVTYQGVRRLLTTAAP